MPDGEVAREPSGLRRALDVGLAPVDPGVASAVALRSLGPPPTAEFRPAKESSLSQPC
ncbi:hypothetical protein [Streptomyces sp. NPDC101206]|uniref:hypothetical protein n=1 Tax=Streptomyces sp. NPDC101206 TaxID=3366128 RepID=UPI00380A6191